MGLDEQFDEQGEDFVAVHRGLQWQHALVHSGGDDNGFGNIHSGNLPNGGAFGNPNDQTLRTWIRCPETGRVLAFLRLLPRETP